MEIWKDIEGYESYYKVRNLGNVRSNDRKTTCYRYGKKMVRTLKGQLVRPQPRRHGYLGVWLYKDCGGKQYSVHRLVAEAFCEKHEGCNEVNHKNEIKTDNRAENLEWCDRKYNVNFGTAPQKRIRHNKGTSRRVRQYDMNGNFIKEFPSMKEAQRQTGIFNSSICFAIKGRYSHAGGYKWEYAD